MKNDIKKCMCRISVFVLMFLIVLQCYLTYNMDDNSGDVKGNGGPNIIIWWTPFVRNISYSRTCGTTRCFFSENRYLLDHTKLKAILFYGSSFNITDLPLPRSSHHLWSLFHEESPKNVPLLMYDIAQSLFNVTATFSQNSDYPLTLQYLKDYETLISRKYVRTVEQKNHYQQDELLAPVLYLQSICDAMSGRDEYVSELMKYINVDSYGKCLNNKELPESLSGNDYLSTIDTDELNKFISRYKFIISYENSVCNDYVTEKLWRTLIVGSVPVYFGAPNIKQWLPNKNSAILIDDFKSPKELAEFLLNLNENDVEYNTYLRHKSLDPHRPIITNTLLLNHLAKRPYRTDQIVDDFECFVCANRFGKRITNKGYECGEQLAFPQMEENMQETYRGRFWQSYVKQGKCEAETLEYLARKNFQFSETDFRNLLIRRYEMGLCTEKNTNAAPTGDSTHMMCAIIFTMIWLQIVPKS